MRDAANAEPDPRSRPRPQYGEYATPEEQRAGIQEPAPWQQERASLARLARGEALRLAPAPLPRRGVLAARWEVEPADRVRAPSASPVLTCFCLMGLTFA